MRTEFKLTDGYKTAKGVYIDVVLKVPNAGDIMDSSQAAERVVATPEGFQLVLSPTLIGFEVLRRQIVSIGPVQGPISLDELRALSREDLQILQSKAEELDAAMLKQISEVAARGRSEAPSDGAGRT